jgi:hypothetical protein
MVSTLDFESNDPGSNPGRTCSTTSHQQHLINNIMAATTSWRQLQLHHGGNYNNIMAATSTTSWRQLQQHHGGNFNNI